VAGCPPWVVMTGPRAVGIRRRYDEIPDRVRSWVDAQLGSPVVSSDEQVGGMSPGCATRLRCADGRRAFVKAVGPELNPMTPQMFRHEAQMLTHLGANALWAELQAVLDEPGGWVALLLEDVPGRPPDMTRPDDIALVLAGTDQLVEQLSDRATGLDIATYAQSFTRYDELWPAIPDLPPGVLPVWARDHADEFQARQPDLIASAVGNAVIHNDIRNDNLIVREDGSLVFVDWGVARAGASWVDPLVVRLEWVEHPTFDDLVHQSPALANLGDDQVTTFLFTFGAWLAYRTTVAVDTGLPTLNDFRTRESARLLEGARRRRCS